MKYFSYKLWRDFQNTNFEEAEREWDMNLEAYKESLRLIEPWLSKKAYRMISQGFFHDSQIVSIDTSEYEFLILNVQKNKKSHILKFKGLQRWSTRFDSDIDSLSLGRMMEWGYEELSISSEGMLILEVLFSSGAVFTIEFKELLIPSVKNSKKLQ